jgi:NAD(P)-dependent dehydrogenase (short-subunit alcohol dehydrogenase family)
MTHKVAIVTGGANGIGRAVVERLSADGCSVAILDREDWSAADVVAQLGGVRLLAIGTDVADSRAVGTAIDHVVDRFGGVDYLVNCAGSFIAAGLEATDEEWERSLTVNIRGCAATVAAVAPHMARRGGGSIVNVSSISGRVAQPNRWTYNATKGAITSVTRCQALDLAPLGVRVNSVAPGWIWTREVERAAVGGRHKWEPTWGRYAMLRRLGETAEVAAPIAFLLSEAASFITGTELAIDGGYLALGPEGLGDTSAFAGSA